MMKRLLICLAALLAVATPARGQTPTVLEYYHVDAVGSVRVVTDQSGTVIRRHDDDPFGQELPTAPTGADTLRFAGKERDAETSLGYFGARHYASRTGRFTTVDPVLDIEAALIDPQRWNRYTYALNNPLTYVDPDGRNPVLLARLLELAQRAAQSPAAQRAATWAQTQGVALWNWATRFFNSPAGQETVQTVGELITGAQAPAGRLPAISASTIETAVATGAEAAGRQGTAAFRALASHIDRGDPAFQGVAKTAESALGLLRGILSDPSRVATGQKTVDIYNAAGQGVRLELATGKFIGFLDASKATR